MSIDNSKKFNKMTGLGRGLGALLQDSEKDKGTPGNVNLPVPAVVASSINEIDIHNIQVNPYQPRTQFDQEALNDLAESIRVQGIIQPITVRQIENGYQLISGERRLQASKSIGMTRIPAYIRTADDQQMLEMALIENIQRENLNSIEIALSYQRLMLECNLKQEELGDRVGKNRTTVNNYLRLLRLPTVIQAALRDSQLSMGHARAIITIDNPESQLAIFSKTLQNGWSVRKVEEEVRKLSAVPAKAEKVSELPAEVKQNIKQLQFQLSSYFGSKVSIKSNENSRGEIKIPFETEEELQRILKTLKVEGQA